MRRLTLIWTVAVAALLASLIDARAIDLNVRQFTYTNDVSVTRPGVRKLKWYGGESVKLDLYVHRGGSALFITNTVVPRWEAFSYTNESVAFIMATGTVVDSAAGHLQWDLAPTLANLATNTYLSHFRLYQAVDGTNRYVGSADRRDVQVLWGPDADNTAYSGPFTNVTTETDPIWSSDRPSYATIAYVDGATNALGAAGGISADTGTNIARFVYGENASNYVVQADIDSATNHADLARLNEAEVIAGDWDNTANPWADDEVANALTVDEPGIASTIARDAEVAAATNQAVIDATNLVAGVGYLTAEADTLDAVVSRGGATANPIEVGGITNSGPIIITNGGQVEGPNVFQGRDTNTSVFTAFKTGHRFSAAWLIGGHNQNQGTMVVATGTNPTSRANGDLEVHLVITNKSALIVRQDGTTDVQGNVVTNLATPTADDHAATKGYVDGNDADTTYTAGTHLRLDGTVFSFSNEVNNADLDATSGNYVQTIQVDERGAVTGIVAAADVSGGGGSSPTNEWVEYTYTTQSINSGSPTTLDFDNLSTGTEDIFSNNGAGTVTVLKDGYYTVIANALMATLGAADKYIEMRANLNGVSYGQNRIYISKNDAAVAAVVVAQKYMPSNSTVSVTLAHDAGTAKSTDTTSGYNGLQIMRHPDGN